MGKRKFVLRVWHVVVVIIAIALAIVAVAVSNHNVEQTRKAYAQLPVVVLVTRMTPNVKGVPITTYIPTGDGGEQPVSTASYVPVFLRSSRDQGLSSLDNDAVCKIYYDATSAKTQAMVIRAPKADEAQWVQMGRLSPCYGNLPRYVVEYHFVPGNIPVTNTSSHAESED